MASEAGGLSARRLRGNLTTETGNPGARLLLKSAGRASSALGCSRQERIHLLLPARRPLSCVLGHLAGWHLAIVGLLIA